MFPLHRVGGWIRVSPKLPVFVLALTLYSCYGGPGLLGYNGCGLAWLVAMVLATLTLVKNRFRTAFPIVIWLPWIAILLLGLTARWVRDPVQRTVMMICPLMIGLAVASFPAKPHQLQAFLNLLRLFAVLLWVVLAIRSPVFFSRWGSPLASAMMTTSLICAFLAVEYMHGRRGLPVGWLLMILLPIGCVCRMASLASILTLPLTPARMNLRYRFAMIVAGITLALVIFHLPRIQQKMFFSGRGTLKDVRFDNPDFRSNGRTVMLEVLWAGIVKRPVWGHGADACDIVCYEVADQTHPHNDYLRVLYDYGFVGLGILLVAIIVQVQGLWRLIPGRPEEVQIVGYTAVASFGLFLLFMLTDNVIIYPSFFGNLQFTLVGLIYGYMRTETPPPAVSPVSYRASMAPLRRVQRC